MSENKLDVKSPYMRNEINNLEEIKRRITKRASFEEGSNVLSLSSHEKEASDNLLEQKVQKISKRIVGEEIKKFAEVASLEISNEIENIEERLNKKLESITDSLAENMLLQNENISVSEGRLEEEIESKLGKLNSILREMEERINDLEVFALSDKKETEVKIEAEAKEKEVKTTYSLNLSKDKKEEKMGETSKTGVEEGGEEVIKCAEVCVEEVNGNEILKCEEVCKVTIENTPEELEYIENKIKKVSNLFEKNGFLFKKNIYESKLKDLIMEDFVKNKDQYKDITENDKEKICNLLTDLMDTLTIDPEVDESIESFMRRAYSKKFFLEN